MDITYLTLISLGLYTLFNSLTVKLIDKDIDNLKKELEELKKKVKELEKMKR